MKTSLYTVTDVMDYIRMCAQADMYPTVDGMVETECQMHEGDEARAIESSVRAAYAQMEVSYEMAV